MYPDHLGAQHDININTARLCLALVWNHMFSPVPRRVDVMMTLLLRHMSAFGKSAVILS